MLGLPPPGHWPLCNRPGHRRRAPTPCTTIPLQVSRWVTPSWTPGAHRSIRREGGVLVLAQGATEGLEGLAVPSVPLDGGLDDLKADRRTGGLSARMWRRVGTCLSPRTGPIVTALPTDSRQQKPALRSGNVAQGGDRRPPWSPHPSSCVPVPPHGRSSATLTPAALPGLSMQHWLRPVSLTAHPAHCRL